MRPSLVIGASGLVGEHLMRLLPSFGRHAIPTYRTNPVPDGEQLDIRASEQVNVFFERFQPAVVFLPAALTNVDYCEENSESSYATNVIGVRNVVEASNRMHARMIYFSTDYIFDGTSGPYDEDSLPGPISEYGRQKLIAEHHILLKSVNSLIIRTTVIYGWERQGKNFVSRLIKTLKEGNPVRVPDDQLGTPTYAPDLAEKAIKLSIMDLNGVVNIAGSNCITRYEFAREAARTFLLDDHLIQPVSTQELNQPARRPLLAGLKTAKATALLGTICSSSSEGLHLMRMQQN